jgi:hypothetical protein
MDDLERRIDRMLESREVDGALIDEILTLPPDTPGLYQILEKLQAIASKPALDIEDYYRPGTELYTLQWPLAPPTAAMLPVPFEELDRKSQFFVLFQEWTRRELEATTACNSGALADARTSFEECLERAEQLDVAELRARSHEGLASVYEMTDDRAGARRELEAAMAAREP